MFGLREKKISNQLDELVSLQRAQHEETRAGLEQTRSGLEQTRSALAEFREFNREILLRNEKVYLTVIARLEDLGEEIRGNTEQTRAQTEAVLRLLDRFDGNGDDPSPQPPSDL